MQSERGDLRTACAANLNGAGLKDKGMVSRGWIGVQIQPVTSAEGLGLKGPGGALLAEPQADSPAARAGILSGDVITEVNGHAVKECTRPREANRFDDARRHCQAYRLAQRRGEELLADIATTGMKRAHDTPRCTARSKRSGGPVARARSKRLEGLPDARRSPWRAVEPAYRKTR
jgi:hypothetical protein